MLVGITQRYEFFTTVVNNFYNKEVDDCFSRRAHIKAFSASSKTIQLITSRKVRPQPLQISSPKVVEQRPTQGDSGFRLVFDMPQVYSSSENRACGD